MKDFEGFPRRSEFTPVPNLFITRLLSEIDDLAEARVTLHVFWLLYRRRGYPRFATGSELAADPVLLAGLDRGGPSDQAVRRGLEAAVERGTLLRLTLERNGEREDLYFVNTDEGRRAVADVTDGRVRIEGRPVPPPPPERRKPPNIFSLYEQNVGLLSPIITEELKEAEGTYPASWIEDAFREAVALNKRSWRYIARILERWAQEGKDNGEPEGDPKAHPNPRDYLKWRGNRTED